jgi:hypothetical protein
MGGPLIYDVTAVSWDQDHMSLLAVNTQRNILHKIYITGKSWTPSLTTFENLDGVVGSIVGYK